MFKPSTKTLSVLLFAALTLAGCGGFVKKRRREVDFVKLGPERVVSENDRSHRYQVDDAGKMVTTRHTLGEARLHQHIDAVFAELGVKELDHVGTTMVGRIASVKAAPKYGRPAWTTHSVRSPKTG